MFPIFKYSVKDIYPLIYCILVGLIPVLVLYFQVEFFWWAIMLPFHALLLSNLVNGPMHNHVHCKTFSNSKLNELYEIVIGMITGIAFETWKYVHLTHHAYNNDKATNGKTKDISSIYFGTDGTVPKNVWLYAYTNPFLMLKEIVNDAFTSVSNISNRVGAAPGFINSKRVKIQTWAIVFFALALCYIDIFYGLWYSVVVMCGMRVCNKLFNYGTHRNTDQYRGDKTRDSVSSYHPLVNWATFNNGYHQEHHFKPGTHWTKLSDVTGQLPLNRVTINGFHWTNVPLARDFKQLLTRQIPKTY